MHDSEAQSGGDIDFLPKKLNFLLIYLYIASKMRYSHVGVDLLPSYKNKDEMSAMRLVAHWTPG